MPHRGFEPLVSALRVRRPGPLDECGARGTAAIVCRKERAVKSNGSHTALTRKPRLRFLTRALVAGTLFSDAVQEWHKMGWRGGAVTVRNLVKPT